jgi:hypothetical protein|tara:strand:+ start:19 stop:291 length:273 start_codon:yes stop_codon:yes gene_type:complete
VTDARLERIEKKLDEMGEAIVALARMEERMVSLFKRMDSYDKSQARNIERLEKLEKVQGFNGQTLRFAERVFWIIISAIIGFLFFKMRNP